MTSKFLFDRSQWTRLTSRISSAIGNRSEAEDVLSSAYVRLAGRDADDVENHEAFLYRTAINLHIDERRKAASRGSVQHLEIDDQLADPSPLQDEVLDSRRQWQQVEAVVERLPERTREILLMRRLDGMRYKDIAETLKISESAVEKHIAKAATLLLRASRNR